MKFNIFALCVFFGVLFANGLILIKILVKLEEIIIELEEFRKGLKDRKL